MARRHVMKLTFKTDVGLYGVSKERGLALALAFDKIIGRTAYGSRLVKRPLDRVPRDVHCSFWESNLRRSANNAGNMFKPLAASESAAFGGDGKTTRHGRGDPGRRTMPRKLCAKCHGQRTISCPACHGTGKKTIANTSVSDCEECGRTGRRPCDVCGGTGEVEHLSVALNGS